MKFLVEKGFSMTRGEKSGQSFNVYVKDSTKYYTIERYTDGSFENMNCWYVRGNGIMRETCLRSCKKDSNPWKQITKAVEKTL